MATAVSKTGNQKKAEFTPNIDNFKVSLSYEGLLLKKGSENKNIEEIKRKYKV